MPVVVVSSLTASGSETAVRAVEMGALEVVCKPTSDLREMTRELTGKIRSAAAAKLPSAPAAQTGGADASAAAAPLATGAGAVPVATVALPARAGQVLAIGASTGGTEAIKHILTQLPAETPGTVIVQHMPEHFTAAFARRLDGLCAMEVREACNGDVVTPGLALIAPGNYHMALVRAGAGYRVSVKDGPPIQGHRPSVDVLFHSVARQAGSNAVGTILTGMGADGARGLLAMRGAGAATFAQDERSCVVFGMPKEAIAMGAAQRTVPLDRMAAALLAALREDCKPLAVGGRQ